MHWQTDSNGDFAETRLYRFAGATAAVCVWMIFASAGWSWLQIVERLLELPGMGGAIQEWTGELLSPDSIARRAFIRTMRG